MGSLGTVLERLSGLFSKYFLVASYFPTLIFLALNGFFFYSVNLPFHKSIGQDLAKEGFWFVGVLISAGILSFLLSTLSQMLREALENPWFLPRKLREEMELNRMKERDDWVDQLEARRTSRLQLIKSQSGWEAQLSEAREAGKKLNNAASSYSSPSKLDVMLLRFRHGKEIDSTYIDAVVKEFAAELAIHNPEEIDPADSTRRTASAILLDKDEMRLRGFLKQIPTRSESEAFDLYNRLQLNFARNEIVATRIGNIGLSVQAYFSSRYSLNFNFFWTRIQQLLQKEDKFFDVLQAAKAQLDFHIALFWLIGLFAVIWTPYCAVWGLSIWLLGFAAIGAPLFAWMFYELAVQSYRSYADLLRTSVDIYHFGLLGSLHIALPASVEDERQVWTGINQWLGLGDYRDVEYKHPASSNR